MNCSMICASTKNDQSNKKTTYVDPFRGICDCIPGELLELRRKYYLYKCFCLKAAQTFNVFKAPHLELPIYEIWLNYHKPPQERV